MTADEILLAQIRIAELPLGKRIVYWAARFIGTPPMNLLRLEAARGGAVIAFTLPRDASGVSLGIYDLSGRRVRELWRGPLPAAVYAEAKRRAGRA